ncbi:PH domain-containing protein [Hymenobacter cellulosivorans]|uniref:PH domain-containing protein n=1 Tax=Hymenobacter cellulosivorans TaxID=2932249 RepID=A0ABY4F938_9BACT|nr:PH domain-containing protein [Hymenobacter cellulosivorans]UOQ52940.1 PH domain-containing protein [Hymenobacter cellulosivorans]
MSNFPVYGLIAIGVFVLTQYLAKASKHAPGQDAEGHILVLMPGFFRLLGLFSCAIGLGLLLWALFEHNPDDMGLQLLLAAMFGGMGLYLLLSWYGGRLTLTPEGIWRQSMLGQPHLLRWEAIQTVRFSAFSMAVQVSDGKRQVKCYTYSVGANQLVEELTRHLGRSRAELGIPNF